MAEFKICDKRKKILGLVTHMLIEGGPGSGKTTIALLKAKALIDAKTLFQNQKVLFLSFARATVSRVEEQAKDIITKEDKKYIEINTYHGFAWSILQSFGYLVNFNKFFKLLTPPNEAALLAEIPDEFQDEFLYDKLENEGLLSFRLFAKTVVRILLNSSKLCSLLSNAFPVLIVDEFQDTDEDEWQLIKLLAQKSTIIALADLDQRIFEFRGASVKRIPEFISHFPQASRFDLGTENNRSPGTDIIKYGDDILTGDNVAKSYNDVILSKYGFTSDLKSSLKFAVLNAIKRVRKNDSNRVWSIAVLVKTKQDTLNISSYFTANNIYHDVLIDPAGPSLSASLISKLLEPVEDTLNHKTLFIQGLIVHIKGRKGNKIPKKDLELVKALEKYLKTQKIVGQQRLKLISEIDYLLEKCDQLKLIGNPELDWLSIRKLFQDSTHPTLVSVYEDARYLRLLNKGANLSDVLAETWRNNGNYRHASIAVDAALTQEHFSMSQRLLKGVIVMNMHKSKGKEFDEVIIWEEMFKPIVPMNANEGRISSERLLLRVAVTRAKSRTTILTPENAVGILF